MLYRFGGVAVFGAAFAQNRVRIRDEVVAVRQVFLLETQAHVTALEHSASQKY